jgi:CheY-like chemotaxis protein/two-component sensor histidine kinase
VTERLEAANEELHKAARAKDEFLGTLGHELRNPLAAISNAAYLLAHASDATREAALGIIERQTRNMVRIVDDLLDVSRITHGKINLRLGPVNLESVVRNAVSATEHERTPGDQKIEISLPTQPAWVRADAARLEQIVSNLLGNASKFAPVGGHIWLDVEREAGNDGGWAAIRVRDGGPGIDPHVLPRIFELFVQGERTDDRARTGVGIGLALARRLVEMHGGTIEARNLPGQGSEFLVRLPLCSPPANERRRTGRGDEPAAAVRRVLIVDDNRDAARALQILLSREAHEVRVANNGKAALSAAREFKPHVVLLDVGLPDIDGLAVARKLREDDATRDAVLVALTGYAGSEDKARAHEAGFDDHLTKPTNPEKLFRLIAGAGAD